MNEYLITNHITKEKVIIEANSAQEAAQRVGCRINLASPLDIGQPKLSGMPIQKAIEILNHHSILLMTTEDHDYLDAINLGIEALKREEILRREIPYDRDGLLPGETEN